GRFAAKDMWQGDASNPMTHNLWQYVNDNPINTTDPTGQCPRPPSQLGTGEIIYLAAFIPVRVSHSPASIFGVDLFSDNRNFTSDSSQEDKFGSSRAWLWIDTVTGEILRSRI